MAKYYGSVGYAETKETSPGVYEEEITSRMYKGDVLRLYSRRENVETLNDNISINNRISIVADPYAMQNFSNIRFVEYMGTKWKVTSVEVEYPRLILEIGGVYNG